MLCRVTLRGCCQPPPVRHGNTEREGELEVTFVEVKCESAAGYREECPTDTVTTHEEPVPSAKRTWDCTTTKDTSSEISTTCSTTARENINLQDVDLPNVSCNSGNGEALSHLNKCSVQNNKCMGPDALAMNEGSVEIDLSAEFPPERREAQEDFAQINAAPLSFWEHDLPPHVAWWREVGTTAVKGLNNVTAASRLLEVRIIRHGPITEGSLPWHSEQSEVLYESMGVQDPEQNYIVVWLNFGNVSLLLVSETVDHAILKAVFADDPMSRLKFLINPVRASVKFFPTKPPKDVATLGSYFGQRSVSCTHSQTAMGVNYTVLRIDLHAKFFMRVLLQKLAFRRGNVVDMLIVDWPTEAMVASCRLLVTEEVLQLLGSECGVKPEPGKP